MRFDIGFIGRGNPEIALDKVSRFARHEDIEGTNWYMATIIIVDRLGRGSRVEQLAREIDGEIVQMSGAYWPQEVAMILERRLGYKHPLVDMDQQAIEGYLKEALRNVPLESFIRYVPLEQLIETDTPDETEQLPLDME